MKSIKGTRTEQNLLKAFAGESQARNRYTLGKCVDLGTISLKIDETILQQVDVTAEKNRVVYKLDRQRINASASLVAAGGTAVDVLKSTPSIRVDADGNVTFRGSSGFLVYVDGKQSPLEGAQALQQVAASNIEDIEIITTPSARYRTEGDVGIINIITKRRDDVGVSGAVNLAGSTIGAWNADALVSHRKGANRWYVGAAFSENKGKSDFSQRKTTIVDDYVTTSDADGTRHSNVVSYIGRIGWEYTKNGHNLLVPVTETYNVTVEHNYIPAVTDPTCTTGGYTTYRCSVCGDSYVANARCPRRIFR